MSANLIIEVSRIKEMMGINETQPKNGLLLVESRGSFTKSLWKEILELGEKYESKDAAQRWTSVRQRLLNMMEENGSFTQMDRITKINRFMKELEQSASTKSVDEILGLLEKELTTPVMNKIESKISDYVDNQVKLNMKTELAKDGSDVNNLVKQDVEEEIQKYVQKEDFQSLSYASQIKSLDEFVTKLKTMYDTTFKLDVNSTILDDIIEPLRKEAQSNLGGKSISQEVEERIQKELETENYKAATSLEQLAILNNLRKTLKDDLNKKLGGKTIANKTVNDLVDEIFDETIQKIETQYEASFFNKMIVAFRDFPGGIDGIASMINTWVQGRNSALLKFEKDVDDIIVKIEKGEMSESYYRDIADKIKIVASEGAVFKKSADTFFDNLKQKLKQAFPEDDKKAQEIIDKINSGEELTQFFTKAKQHIGLGTRFDEVLDILVDSFRKRVEKDLATALKFSKGAAKRWSTFVLGGTLRTFEEWNQRLSQKRKFFIPGLGNTQGFNAKSYIDMYLRVWVVSNLIVPLAYNFLTTCLGSLIALFIPNTVFGQEYRDENIFQLTWDEYLDDVMDTFDIFTNTWNEKNGDIAPQDKRTWAGWAKDFINLVIPFNSKIDDIVSFLKDTPNMFKKFDKEANKLKQEGGDLIDKGVKEGNKIAKRVRKTYNDEMLETLPEGERRVWKGIRSDSGLGEDEISLLQDYSNGDKEGNMWVEDPSDESIKYSLTDNPDIYDDSGKIRKDWDPTKTSSTVWKDGNTYKPLKDLYVKIKQKTESIVKKTLKKIIMEEKNGKKFGEDNFKHWKDTFTFKSEDDKNPGQYKEVKISMEDVMDRIDHFRKKYDEDDAFVRAVIDTHEDVVKIMYTKGLADIRESATPRGLALVLRTLNESRGEMEIFSIARPANGNWFLVKGDYTQSQLANMDLEKKEPEDKEKKREVSGSEELKKKEEKAINVLKTNEKEGLDGLPRKVREKVLEKMGRGWTTETPPSFLNKLIEKSQINTIFNDKIEIFKLDSNDDTFDAIVDNSSQIFIKRGFCRSLYIANDKANLNEKQEKVIDHILDKCDRKFGGKLGVRNF
jgi:hypothetical protein